MVQVCKNASPQRPFLLLSRTYQELSVFTRIIQFTLVFLLFSVVCLTSVACPAQERTRTVNLTEQIKHIFLAVSKSAVS